MTARVPQFRLLLAALSLLGCTTSATSTTTYRCVLEGTFQATDCALVLMAARDGAGNPLGFLPVRVDSMVSLGFAYLSENGTTASDGGFALQVFRVRRFTQPATPDTATLYVSGYDTPDPPTGTPPTRRAAVLMRFAPIGELVTPTTGVATFVPVP